MSGCSLSFADTVRTVWIRHELKYLIMFDQLINKHFCVLVMYIVIAGAMNVEQISTQVFSVGNRRAFNKVFSVFLRNAHITFLINIIVSKLIANSSNCDSGFKVL